MDVGDIDFRDDRMPGPAFRGLFARFSGRSLDYGSCVCRYRAEHIFRVEKRPMTELTAEQSLVDRAAEKAVAATVRTNAIALPTSEAKARSVVDAIYREDDMPDFHTFKIRAGIAPADCSIEIDGKPLMGVTKIHFDLIANNLTRLRLEIVGEIEVEGEFRDSAILKVDSSALNSAR